MVITIEKKYPNVCGLPMIKMLFKVTCSHLQVSQLIKHAYPPANFLLSAPQLIFIDIEQTKLLTVFY